MMPLPRRSKLSDLPKKNGRFFVALLAGGPHDLFLEIRERLRKKKGIWIQHHWEYQKPRAIGGTIPSDVDIVIMLQDLFGHSDIDSVLRACDRSGIPCIRTQRKWAAMGPLLNHHGFSKSMEITPKEISAPREPEPDLTVEAEPEVADPESTTETTSATPVQLAFQLVPTGVQPGGAHLSAPDTLTGCIVKVREIMRAIGLATLMIDGDEVTMQFSAGQADEDARAPTGH